MWFIWDVTSGWESEMQEERGDMRVLVRWLLRAARMILLEALRSIQKCLVESIPLKARTKSTNHWPGSHWVNVTLGGSSSLIWTDFSLIQRAPKSWEDLRYKSEVGIIQEVGLSSREPSTAAVSDVSEALRSVTGTPKCLSSGWTEKLAIPK